MKTVILDDDPTGTQSASGVTVLLDISGPAMLAALEADDSVYVLTNTRALPEGEATALAARVRTLGIAAAQSLGDEVQFVLRGDSTLRGHVFAETEVFLDQDPDAVMLFVPAFPAGGRVTVGGVHYVTLDGERVPAHETEFAGDPVFPFSTSTLTDYVAEKSSRPAVGVSLEHVRAGAVAEVLRAAPSGSVVTPDAETDDDIRLIARAVEATRAGGRPVVVRSASPLAAALAGVESDGLLTTPLVAEALPALVLCGSHTAGAAAQLDAIDDLHEGRIVVSTAAALVDPQSAGHEAGAAARSRLRSDGIAVVTTERTRSSEHNTLLHGERVMTALTTAVRSALPDAGVVISKGGITSAEVASTGLGARTALVLGQVLPGVSVWQLTAIDGRELLYVVVPGNVGDANTLRDVLHALRVVTPSEPRMLAG